MHYREMSKLTHCEQNECLGHSPLSRPPMVLKYVVCPSSSEDPSVPCPQMGSVNKNCSIYQGVS